VNISLDTVNPDKYSEITGGGSLSKVLKGIEAAREAGFGVIKLNCVVDKDADEPEAKGVAEFARETGLQVRFIPRMDMAKGTFSAVIGGNGGICSICNRLRLTCDGRIKPCLFSDLAFNIRELGMEEALRQAVEAKPQSGIKSVKCHFYNIGG
jgi:cyclic pyranopterin phosphate synthase